MKSRKNARHKTAARKKTNNPIGILPHTKRAAHLFGQEDHERSKHNAKCQRGENHNNATCQPCQRTTHALLPLLRSRRSAESTCQIDSLLVTCNTKWGVLYTDAPHASNSNTPHNILEKEAQQNGKLHTRSD